jgi:class 3 adenylate cyclase/tetratricopeptide (TPR) repeat protein
MHCPRCQHENPPSAKFCLECGNRLAPTCAQCGTALPAGAKFCLECGKPVDPSPGPSPSPRVYTPKHLADKILTSRSALEGERKQVTVLFADLKGSMELLADRDPEEARKLLDPVLERMMEAVHRYEGTVNSVMGDGIMALFGAPLAHEDHAVRACYAAIDLQRAMRRLTDTLRQTHGVTVQARVGLNSGEVVVRAISSDLHVDYTAVGQTTHLAARMEQLAKPDTTLLTADTLRLAEGYVEVKPLGAMPVNGLAAPVEAYELTGAGPRRSRLSAGAARGLSRFVGRDGELEQLREALGRAASGHGQVVAIVGEPGVGKSRLVWEVTHSHRTHGWLILQAGSVSYGKATPYLPVIDLLKGYLQIADRDEPRAIREKAIGKLLALDRALEPALPAFLALLDVPVEDRRWEVLDPPQRRQRTLDALKRLLLRESQVQPLLVVFEDLHWIDAETQAVVDRLVESLPTARFLLLVNYRPEYRHDWGGKTYYRQLRLDPLAPENATALLEVLLGGDLGLEPLKQLLLARTEGNPFFLEESVRSLVDDGVLVGDRGAYRLVKRPEIVHVPATVQAILAARIDRLPAEDKALLQTASVIGTNIPVAVLVGVAGVPADALAAGLARLQAAEFLYETSLFPDTEYTFKHALTHEVAYGSLLQDRRRVLHARAVTAIEGLYPERLTEHAERLAHHALRGEVWEKAVRYLRQAGAKAMERSAYREAAAGFDQALDTLQHLPESRARTEQVMDLHLDVSAARWAAAEQAKSTEHAHEAEVLAEALGDERRLGRAVRQLAKCAGVAGDSDRAVELNHRALAIATGLNDTPLQTAVNYSLGVLGQARGDYREAAGGLSACAEALQGDRRYELVGGAPLVVGSASSKQRLAWCLAELGEFAEAMTCAEEATRVARELDHPGSLVFAYRSLGLVSLRRGALVEAIPPLERAVELCRIAQVLVLFDVAAAHLGYAYALSGRLSEGVVLLEEALAAPMATGTGNHPLFLAHLGEAHLLAGRSDDALAVARRALDLAYRQKERGNEAWVLRLLGEIAAQADPPDLESAEAHYGQALARADELGMRPLVAHCHLGLGTLYRRTRDRTKAEEHLSTAATLYREMGMGFWLEKAEAAVTGRRRPGDRSEKRD